MGLAEELSAGQDIEVDVDSSGFFKKLRVIVPSFAGLTILADRTDYIKQKGQKENPKLQMVYLGSEDYKIDSGKVVPSRDFGIIEITTSEIQFGRPRYDLVRTILDISP